MLCTFFTIVLAGCGAPELPLDASLRWRAGASVNAALGGGAAMLPPTSAVSQSRTSLQFTTMSIPLDCEEYATQTSGPYMTENNVWGKEHSVGAFSQCTGIGPVRPDGSVSARWTWNWPSGHHDQVKGFPQIIYGQKPGYAPTPASRLPMKLSEIRRATSSFSARSTVTGTGLLAYDLWLTKDPERRRCFACTPITHEIMVVFDNHGGYGVHRNPEWFQESVTIDGVRYRVYRKDDFGAYKWRFIVFQATERRSSATVDFVQLLKYLKTKGWVSGDEYLSSVEFGTEPVLGSGELLLQSFRVDID